MPSGNATDIRNLLATRNLLRTLLLHRQGDARINEKLVVELSSMGDFSTNTWNRAVSPIVFEMKEIVRTKKVRTGERPLTGLFEPTVSKETIMAMRTFLVSATLESGKLVVDKIWGGNSDSDAAKEAIATCATVLQIDDSLRGATWYESLLGEDDKTGYKFRKWRSQGLDTSQSWSKCSSNSRATASTPKLSSRDFVR
jgi:hypothetical protein